MFVPSLIGRNVIPYSIILIFLIEKLFYINLTQFEIFCHQSQIWVGLYIKFICSEKATKFCEILTLLLSYVVTVKSKVKISQNFVALSEYINFKTSKLSTEFENLERN